MNTHSDELRLAYLRYITEGRRMWSDMKETDSRLRVSYCLLVDRRAWTISAVSAASGLTRITVRQVLGDQVERGSVVRVNGGHQITDLGIKRFRARFDEFFQKVREPLFRFHRILGREYPGEGV